MRIRASLVALLLSSSLAAAAPPLERGRLSAPSTASPELVARTALLGRPERAGLGAWSLAARTLPQNHGALVVLAPQSSLPVLGGKVAVRVDDAGQVRWIAGAAVDLSPAGTVPTLTAAEALARAGGGKVSVAPRLMIDARQGQPRLAWEVRLPASRERPDGLKVWIDAHTGVAYRHAPLRHTARPVNMYAQNPVATPALTSVDLGPWLDADSVSAAGPDIRALNCVDDRTCRDDINGTPAYSCNFLAQATTTAGGDFLTYAPGADTATDDAFAELSAEFHLGRTLDLFRGYGFTNLNQQPMAAIVNYRSPSRDGCVDGLPPAAAQLETFDNASFNEAGMLSEFAEDSMTFGQSSIDYAYDGDVVAHEFTHAVMFTTSPELPYGSILDQYGANSTPGGMHEGFADYFSGVLENDPETGEYASAAFGVPFIRTMESGKRCPENLTGEPHDDSEPWSSALWTARQGLAEADRPAFDRAVFTVLYTLTATDDQPSVAAKIVAEVEVEMGAAAADQVSTGLAMHGYGDCNHRVIPVPADGVVFDPAGYSFSPFLDVPVAPVPWTTQMSLDVGGGGGTITATIGSSLFIDGTIELAVKPGSDPILWTYEGGTATSDATMTVPFTDQGNGSLVASVHVDGPGPVALQLQEQGQFALFQGLTVTTEEDPAPDAGPIQPDAGGDPGSDGDGGGCGCQVGGMPSGGAFAGGLLGLVGLALFLRRRK